MNMDTNLNEEQNTVSSSKEKQNLDIDSKKLQDKDVNLEETKELCWFNALADLMEKIIADMSIKDLCRVALVCRSWHEIVEKKMLKMGGPERIFMPDPYQDDLNLADFKLAEVVSSRPHVTLLFCGPTPQSRSKFRTEFKNACKSKFPQWVIIIGTDSSMMDQEEIFSSPMSALFGYDELNQVTRGVLGLSLPNYKQSRIRIAYCISHEHKVVLKAKKLLDQLVPNKDEDQDVKSTLIVLGRSQYTVSTHLLRLIKLRLKPNSYTLWGCITNDTLKIINTVTGDYPEYMGMEGCIGLRISGSGLESHSVVTDLRQLSWVTNKLTKFRDSVKWKRYSMGLVCGPNEPDNKQTVEFYFNPNILMSMIKSVFPNTPFNGLFNSPQLTCFGLDSTRDDSDQPLIHKMSMCIMILTYD